MDHRPGQVTSLPPELLVEIFLWRLGNVGVQLPPPDSTSFLPWTFAHVCSTWRHTVLTEPRLWNALTLTKKPGGRFLPVVEEAFQRSGQLPLSLRLLCHTATPDTQDKLVPEVVGQYAHRIKYLFLESFVDIRVDHIIPLPADLFNSLDTLSIAWTSSLRSREGTVGQIHAFEGISTLRRVKITLDHQSYHTPFHMSLTDLHIPWTQITHLDLSDTRASLSIMLYVFSHFTRLLECRLYLSDQERCSGFSPITVSSPPDRFILPALHTLRIDIINTEGELILFDNILLRTSFPALSRFYITQNRRDGQLALSPASFVEHLRSSGCTLTHLTFDGVWEWDLGYLLDNMPSLVRLSSLTAPISPLTLKSMARGECAANLEQLACRIGVTDIEDLLAVLDMRWSQEHQARTLGTSSPYKPLRTVAVTVVEPLPAADRVEWDGIMSRLAAMKEHYGITMERARFIRYDRIDFSWPVSST